jgi:hypothetical protein
LSADAGGRFAVLAVFAVLNGVVVTEPILARSSIGYKA